MSKGELGGDGGLFRWQRLLGFQTSEGFRRLGFKLGEADHILNSASFNGPDHPKCANKKKSIVGDMHSDDDYIPSNSGDDDSFDVLEYEVQDITLQNKNRYGASLLAPTCGSV